MSTLPAFAEVGDLAARIPGGISDDDELRAQAALDDAAVLIRGETRQNWVDDSDALALPTGKDAWRADVLFRVNLAAAMRAFTNPDQLTQMSVGSYAETHSNPSPDVYLTSYEKRLVRKAAGQSGLGTVQTTRSEIGPTGRPLGLEVDEYGLDRYLDTRDQGAAEALVDVTGGDAAPYEDPSGL